MKLGETSLLAVILWPLFKLKSVRTYYGDGPYQSDLYEHTMTGLVCFAIFYAFNLEFLLLPAAFTHVIIKELVYDVLIKKLHVHKVDLITRTYGWSLVLVLWLVQLLAR